MSYDNSYLGFEQGPIRPPSESRSLLVRVTRNCHWNRCAFCPVYKGTKFSVRTVNDVIRDLDAVAAHVERLNVLSRGGGILFEQDVRELFHELPPEETASFRAALAWFLSGMESVFLQDADSLVIKPARLTAILNHLRLLFPTVKRITSYSRSDTVDRMADSDLQALREAGLNRIHIGMESGSDIVLAMMCKGVGKDAQVRAGQKVKKAGIELSEYYMPGLGGKDLYRENALETADALNRIDPDFIRLRTLVVSERCPLVDEERAGRFRRSPEVLIVEEILLFLQALDGITSYVASDHALNLFPEVEGRLPSDRERMISPLTAFLRLEPECRCLYQVGRRFGIFSRLDEMHDPARLAEAGRVAGELGVTVETCDEITEELRKRLI